MHKIDRAAHKFDRAAAALLLALFLLLQGCSQTPAPSDAGTTPSASQGQIESTRSADSPADTPAPQTLPPETTQAPVVTTETPQADESWKLLLVNADHPIPEPYEVTLKALRNDQYVDERIYPELQQMFDDARAQQIYPLINESYRSAERQQQILDKYIANYEAAGMDHDDAVRKARETVALPGTSEHQLGLALDIIAEYGGDSTSTWEWLRENCWRYGFILRYPADKEAITGITYEPWHFRYVGAEAAKEIMNSGLCLEEYVAQLGG